MVFEQQYLQIGTALGGGNGGVNVLPSLLGEAMARGLKEVKDGCPEEALASSMCPQCGTLPQNGILVDRCAKRHCEMRTESISRCIRLTKHQK